jgi:hypothetical protein
MTTKHYAVLGGLIVAVGTQLAGLKGGWADVLTPLFVSGLVIQIGTTITALFMDAPKKDG